MFKNRYMTRGVSADIPMHLQILMWSMIDNMEVSEKDYLQIFRLKVTIKNGKRFQMIIHEQEQPEYKKEYYVPIYAEKGINEKIYVIDDVDHCTMLLAKKY